MFPDGIIAAGKFLIVTKLVMWVLYNVIFKPPVDGATFFFFFFFLRIFFSEYWKFFHGVHRSD